MNEAPRSEPEMLHLAYATDTGYLLPTKIAVASALYYSASPARIQVHILDCGIPDAEWDAWLDGSVCGCPLKGVLKRHRIRPETLEGFRAWHGSLAAYARLYLPTLLPDVDWCVYADGDTLFTDDPLLLSEFFDDCLALLGHEDCISTQPEWFKAHGLVWEPAQYVCSGFLLMNLKKFREEGLTKRCLAFIRDYSEELAYPDQDALYYACRGQTGQLPLRWGCFSWAAYRYGRPGCIHYPGERPWELPLKPLVGLSDAAWLWLRFAIRGCGGRWRSVTGRAWIVAGLLRLMSLGLQSMICLCSLSRRFRTRYDVVCARIAPSTVWRDLTSGYGKPERAVNIGL